MEILNLIYFNLFVYILFTTTFYTKLLSFILIFLFFSIYLNLDKIKNSDNIIFYSVYLIFNFLGNIFCLIILFFNYLEKTRIYSFFYILLNNINGFYLQSRNFLFNFLMRYFNYKYNINFSESRFDKKIKKIKKVKKVKDNKNNNISPVFNSDKEMLNFLDNIND